VEQDRRNTWNGQERRGCYFEPESAAQAIATYLDAYQVQRDKRRESERFEQFGRAIASRVLWLIGAVCLYALGHKHESIIGFLEWAFKG